MDIPLLIQKEEHEQKKYPYSFLTSRDISSSFLSFFFFPAKYISKYNKQYYEAIEKGTHKGFELDFFKLPPLLKTREALDDDILTQIEKMEKIWEKTWKSGHEISLYKLAYLTVPHQVHAIFISLFFNVAFRLLYSFFLGYTIKILSQYFYQLSDSDSEKLRYFFFFAVIFRKQAIISTVLMISIALGFVFSERLYNAIAFQTGMKLRVIFVGLLYRKVHQVSLTSLNQLSMGRFVNIVQSDLAQLDVSLRSTSTVFISPIVLIVGLGMMWSQFGLYSLISIGITLLYMPIQSWVVKLSAEHKKQKNKYADDRLKIVSEIIESIRVLKQYTWEGIFKQNALQMRQLEQEAQRKIYMVTAATSSLSATSVYISLLIMIYFYVTVGEYNLSADKIFSAILILQIMRSYCVQQFSDGMLAFVNLNIAEKRVKDILKLQQIVNFKEEILSYSNEIEMSEFLDNKVQPSSVEFKNFTAYWSKSQQENKQPVLIDINLDISNEFGSGQLVFIIGKVGSGKTSMLLSILREIPSYTGELKINGNIAYVEQEPYVFSGTLRENILFGKDYVQEIYDSVIEASCLEDDLKLMPDYDETYVGEKGVTLSGGQKARLSFARALYSDSDIYLLDDPLSAVDSKVARTMFEKGIKGMLRTKKVIVVTHLIHFAFEGQYLVVMNNGGIVSQGTPQEVVEDLGGEFEQYIEFTARRSFQQFGPSNLSEQILSKKTLEELSQLDPLDEETENFEGQLLENKKQKEQRELAKRVLEQDMQHDVTWSTFQNYIEYAGGLKKILTIYIFFVLEISLTIFLNRLFGFWAKDNEDLVNNKKEKQSFSHSQYAKASILIVVLVQLFSYTKSYTLFNKVMNIATSIYVVMINKLVRAKVSYFDKMPSGQIISRFANDISTAEQFLGFNYMMNLEGITSLILTTLVVCLYNPIILLPSSVFLVFLIYVKKFFTPFLKYSRICDSVTRGPLNTELSSTLQGLIVIRAYKEAVTYIKKYEKLLYENCKAILSFSRANTTLSVVLEFSLYLQIAVGSALIIWEALNDGLKDPGEIGFSLLLLIHTSQNFTDAFRSYFLIEINMNNVERMFVLTKLESEAQLSLNEDANLSKNWPSKGEVEFKDVYLKYENALSLSQEAPKYALNGVSLQIPAGQRVGIVGRTGAGKSSILQALFRMVEVETNSTRSGIFIDGVNIRTIGLHVLRSCVSIIPQLPVVFQGTIRRNLDPLGEYSQEQLENSLEQVDLKEKVDALPLGMDTDMSVSSNVFSVGQKQLVCMARVILRKNKIVVLDEATSNVDLKTDSMIQKMIKHKFQGCTVITIAHRLDTIADYDLVIVMDKGQLVEYDHPFKLLVKKVTDSKITNTEGLFAQMVMNTGKNNTKVIFKNAQTSYMKKILR